MGHVIGVADRDQVLAALVWTSECRIACQTLVAWQAHVELVTREIGEAERRSGHSASVDGIPNYVAAASSSAASELLDNLRKELREAEHATSECEAVYAEISRFLGLVEEESRSSDVLDSLVPLRRLVVQARERLSQLIADDRATLHEIALWEAAERRSLASDNGVSLSQVDRMPKATFTALVLRLLKREGYTTEAVRDPTTADPEALISVRTPGGQDMSLTCRHIRVRNRPDVERYITTPTLHRLHLQTVRSGTAVLLVTNTFLSPLAKRHQESDNVYLVDRRTLQRWVVWEEPLGDLDAWESEEPA